MWLFIGVLIGMFWDIQSRKAKKPQPPKEIKRIPPYRKL